MVESSWKTKLQAPHGAPDHTRHGGALGRPDYRPLTVPLITPDMAELWEDQTDYSAPITPNRQAKHRASRVCPSVQECPVQP